MTHPRRWECPSLRAHFYFLGTYAICSFLIAFGVLSIAASFAPGARSTRGFSLVMAAVWAVRVVLELRYPVEVPIYSLRNPHPILVPILVTTALGFAVASWTGGFRGPVSHVDRAQH